VSDVKLEHPPSSVFPKNVLRGYFISGESGVGAEAKEYPFPIPSLLVLVFQRASSVDQRPDGRDTDELPSVA